MESLPHGVMMTERHRETWWWYRIILRIVQPFTRELVWGFVVLPITILCGMQRESKKICDIFLRGTSRESRVVHIVVGKLISWKRQGLVLYIISFNLLGWLGQTTGSNTKCSPTSRTSHYSISLFSRRPFSPRRWLVCVHCWQVCWCMGSCSVLRLYALCARFAVIQVCSFLDENGLGNW